MVRAVFMQSFVKIPPNPSKFKACFRPRRSLRKEARAHTALQVAEGENPADGGDPVVAEHQQGEA